MIARPEDDAEVLAYFDASPDETVWLRIAWHEKNRFALSREQGRITGMAAYTREHIAQVHARGDVGALVKEVVPAGEKVLAVGGPPEQMRLAIEALGFGQRPVARVSREILMSVELDKLVLPELLSQPGVVARRATNADVFLLIDWRIRYFAEVHQMTPTPEALAEVSAHIESGRLWVLEVNGEIVNTAAFSAVFSHLVQIEYAYGPAELRAKKYGRSVVAGALAAVKPEGITRAVFNTDENNLSVQIGIQPIGFRKTGDHHVTVFADQS